MAARESTKQDRLPLYRPKSPQLPLSSGRRRCSHCEREFDLSEFQVIGLREGGKTRYASWCRGCKYEGTDRWRRDHLEYHRRWKRKHKAKAKVLQARRDIKKRGITAELYDQMAAAQNGCCAICRRPEQHSTKTRLSIDHCHKTKRIRGLLCSLCNQGLGCLGEDPQRLMAAIEYIAKFTEIAPHETERFWRSSGVHDRRRA